MMMKDEIRKTKPDGIGADVVRPGLSRVRTLLHLLGDPQTHLRCVHVAGTNGKGSTCAMLEAILRAAGYRTGLYTSPYLSRPNEELRVGGAEIPDADLRVLIGRVEEAAGAMDDPPSAFEVTTAAALLYFYETGCEIAVLETGMGGTLDATNVIPPPLLTVITNIGIDHVAYLGDTVEEIAAQKAGIIKALSRLVCYDLPQPARGVIDAACRARQVPVRYADFGALCSDPVSPQTFSYRGMNYRISLPGRYQLRNAAVVLEAVSVLRAQGYEIPEAAVRTGLSRTVWPARCEILSADPLFVLDGGHNVQCAQAFSESMQDLTGGRKYTLLFGMLQDKPYEEVLDLIAPQALRLICLTPESPRAVPAQKMAQAARRKGYAAEAYEDIGAGLRAACADGKTPAAVFGSLYLARAVRRILQAERTDGTAPGTHPPDL